MSCYHPMKIFYTGQKTENGKKEGIIAPFDDDLKKYPYELAKAKLGHSIPLKKGFYEIDNGQIFLNNYDEIPCGNCIGCKKDAASDWTNRLLMEIKLRPTNNYFLTITYDDEHYTPTLRKKDIQNFIKRIRKKKTLRYFVCGEYGGKTLRPHYHMILLNCKIGITKKWDRQLSECIDLEKIWGKGRILAAEVSTANIAYTTAYTIKKAKKKEETPEGFEKEFRLMSRKPGIGKEYIIANLEKLAENNRIYMNGERKLPRYAKKLLDENYHDIMEKTKERGKEIAQEKETSEKHIYNTEYKTTVNEKKEQLQKIRMEANKRTKI